MDASASVSDQSLTPPTDSPTLKPVPVGISDHRAQRQWEHYQVRKGIDRYRQSLEHERKDGTVVQRDLGEVQHGQRIASELIGPMIEAVKLKQSEYSSKLGCKNTRKISDAEASISLLTPETIAACAVLTALANPVDAGWTSVRMACAARIRHELEYQEWQRAEKAAEQERKEDGEDGINMFKLMLKRNHGDIDKRIFDKWAKKTDTLVKQEWTQAQKIHIGSYVMMILVESNGWFEVTEKRDEGAKFPKLVFGMTETALALTKNLQKSCELQRPYLAPMICEPLDFVAPEIKPVTESEEHECADSV